MVRRLEQLALIVLLVELPLATIWAIDRIDVGRVLVYFGPHHGIHESDLVIAGLTVPAWWLLFALLIRTCGPFDASGNPRDR